MDNSFGGKYACTSKYRLRSRDDPRFTDRRMQALLANIMQNLHKMNVSQLSHIFYSTVKLRLPEDELLNEVIERLTESFESTEKADRMSLKDLSIVIWAAARIKLPKNSELSRHLKISAQNAILDCI